jgi:NAD-dependent dihydropyrimidine dehydrogenase PreA subunit
MTMHRLIVILMIALLPLRTWAGDIMAIQMTAPTHAELSATVSDTASGHEMQVVEADCPGHGATAAGGVTLESSPDSCSTCVTCQICHSVAIAVSAPDLLAQASFAPAPAFDTPRFTSAEPALSQKPPIS